MTKLSAVRVIAGVSGLLLAGMGLAGCVSPTYGTSETAAEQLVDDIGSAASIGGDKSRSRTGIKYAPRPGLVVPKSGDQMALVEPQASVADKSSGNWAESPEEMRLRLAQEAEDNKDNPNYRSPLNGPSTSAAKQAAAFREARQDMRGNYSERRYLSDPPSSYRAADPSQLTDLGEPEKTKEKRRKKMAEQSRSGSDWWNPFQ